MKSCYELLGWSFLPICCNFGVVTTLTTERRVWLGNWGIMHLAKHKVDSTNKGVLLDIPFYPIRGCFLRKLLLWSVKLVKMFLRRSRAIFLRSIIQCIFSTWPQKGKFNLSFTLLEGTYIFDIQFVVWYYISDPSCLITFSLWTWLRHIKVSVCRLTF